MEYFAVVVIYNKLIQNSASITSLLKLEISNLHIIVIDNSLNEYVEQNSISHKDLKLKYYSMYGNVGLSKAYNYVLNTLKDKDSNDIVIWFDDDTPVSKLYFDELYKISENLNYDVFVPIIYGQNGVIYSPNKAGCLKGKYIKSANQKIPNNKFNAINSCLAVRLKVYKGYTYDENLFMDCVDTKLFDDFRKLNLRYYVLPVKIHQNFFQRSGNKNIQRYWNRFQIRIKDTMYYSSLGGFKRKVCGFIRIIGWGVVYAIKLKSLSFFIKCIKQMKLNIKITNEATK